MRTAQWTAVLVSVIGFLMAFGTLTLPVLAQGPPASPLAGDWTGTLHAGGTALRLVFHITQTSDGTLAATFDSLDQGALGLQFSTATVTDSTVHLEAANIGASFDGTLKDSGKTLDGQWHQGGGTLPLSLTKTADAPTLNRPQEPKPPFPYTVQEVHFPGGASGVTLAGTLTAPPGAGPFPAVVLIAGSGPNDRDETILGHRPFLLLADMLTRRGLAVLRYDKRGIGHSTGGYATATTADFATDAFAAVQFLRTRPEINPHALGLLGHSEGGTIAPQVAAAHPSEIAFAVLLAGTALTGEQILLRQTALIGRAGGVSEADIAQNAILQKKVFALCEHAADPVKAQSEARTLILKTVAALSPAEKKSIGDPKKFAETQSRMMGSPWMKYFLTYDPVPALTKTRCPVLALNGSLDLQVPPKEDLAAIAAALQAGGNPNFITKELPGLNHLFQTATTGSPAEYAQIEETMAPVALQTIGDWIAAHTSVSHK